MNPEPSSDHSAITQHEFHSTLAAQHGRMVHRRPVQDKGREKNMPRARQQGVGPSLLRKSPHQSRRRRPQSQVAPQGPTTRAWHRPSHPDGQWDSSTHEPDVDLVGMVWRLFTTGESV